MSVERVLDKVVQHNDRIIGCILMAHGKVYNNLPDRFELVDVLDVAEYAENIFELAATLDAGPNAFDQAFLEFEEYSFFTRKVGDAVLVLLAEPLEQGTFKKMQVGVNLFMKPLRRELVKLFGPEVTEPAQMPESAEEAPTETKAPQAAAPVEDKAAEEKSSGRSEPEKEPSKDNRSLAERFIRSIRQ